MGIFGGKPEPIEQEKKNIEAMDAKIEENFKTLGRLVYENYRTVVQGDETYNGLIIEIDGNYVQKKVHYDEWLKLQGLLQCAHCNEQITYGSKFCNFCGSNVESQYETVAQTVVQPVEEAPVDAVQAEVQEQE